MYIKLSVEQVKDPIAQEELRNIYLKLEEMIRN